MSLINDALKKAQRERAGHVHSPTPPTPAGPVAPTPPPAPPQAHGPAPRSGGLPWGLIVAIALVLVGGGVAVGVLVFRPSAPEAPAVAAADPAPTAPALPAAAPPPTAAPPASAPAPEPVDAPLPGPPPPPAPLSPPAPTLTAAPAAVPSAPIVAETAAPSPAAPRIDIASEDPRVLAFLESARITGVRPSPDDPRLLMNNRIFRLNDIVDRDLGLRLTGIEPTRVAFTDPRGQVYLKSF